MQSVFYGMTKHIAIIKENVRIIPHWWAIKDSNLGPTGYEPVALTN